VLQQHKAVKKLALRELNTAEHIPAFVVFGGINFTGYVFEQILAN
jgi:hypothetical protein